MKRIAIICREDKASYRLKDIILRELKNDMIYDEEHPDLVISVGGDGTMLSCIHKYINQLDSVYFVGLHTGTLGFYTDYRKEEYMELIEGIKSDKGTVLERYLLKVHYGDKESLALNEVRIENNVHSLVLDVFIDEEHLETFRGNGLCVSTDSGSTAYNRSLGGAIIYPGVKLMQLSEIAGIHHNAYRSLDSSLILDDRHKICVHSLNFSNAILGIDNEVHELKDINQLEIEVSDKCARFIQFKPLSFIKRVKRAFIK